MERARAFLKSTEPVKWLFYGDSITHGALHTFGWRDYSQLFAERVRYEMGRGMDIVMNTAISGNNARHLLDGFDWRVAQFSPHVVFLMIGMNDCTEGNGISVEEFEKNLTELDERISAFGGLTVMQTTCPILPNTSPERMPSFEPFMDTIRKVAIARKLPLIDHAVYWRERSDRHFFWMSNAFHPNEYGHRAFAELLYLELGVYDPKSQCCRLHIP